jgi:hypothetical protein
LKKSALGPVLVYCTDQLADLLSTHKERVLQVHPGISDATLRALDRVGPLGYQILVCVGVFGMRGIDYRSPGATLTLVIAKSFPNMREAIQGFNRVGRFGDVGKRVIFKGV